MLSSHLHRKNQGNTRGSLHFSPWQPIIVANYYPGLLMAAAQAFDSNLAAAQSESPLANCGLVQALENREQSPLHRVAAGAQRAWPNDSVATAIAHRREDFLR